MCLSGGEGAESPHPLGGAPDKGNEIACGGARRRSSFTSGHMGHRVAQQRRRRRPCRETRLSLGSTGSLETQRHVVSAAGSDSVSANLPELNNVIVSPAPLPGPPAKPGVTVANEPQQHSSALACGEAAG